MINEILFPSYEFWTVINNNGEFLGQKEKKERIILSRFCSFVFTTLKWITLFKTYFPHSLCGNLIFHWILKFNGTSVASNSLTCLPWNQILIIYCWILFSRNWYLRESVWILEDLQSITISERGEMETSAIELRLIFTSQGQIRFFLTIKNAIFTNKKGYFWTVSDT